MKYFSRQKFDRAQTGDNGGRKELESNERLKENQDILPLKIKRVFMWSSTETKHKVECPYTKMPTHKQTHTQGNTEKIQSRLCFTYFIEAGAYIISYKHSQKKTWCIVKKCVCVSI